MEFTLGINIQKHSFRLVIFYFLNCLLQPFSYNYKIASHMSHVECVNFIHELRDSQFKVESDRQIGEHF